MRASYSILLAVLFFCTSALFAQMDMSPIPIDSKIKYGQLDNGLTYYIRQNNQPKDRAEFFIAQKVGSVLEEDNQSGLAHFLEHMAFNGTKNFPDKAMINYLETIGVKFGENLNAYTSFDETVYNISNVPVTREGIIDSCLLVLHDWSGFISLDEEEIENERGVIREEMRTRNQANYRQMEKLLPLIMPGSQYAKRMPIGTEEVVMNFKPDELRAYYKKWYRPDLQAIIVIGDIDPDQIEAKIKKMFADIPKPVNAAERIYYPVPDNETPLVGIVKDKESTRTMLSIFYKHDPMPDHLYASSAGFVMKYMQAAIQKMLNDRFAEIAQKANPPFIAAGASEGEFIAAKTKDAWSFTALSKEEGIEEALKTLTREVQRVKQFGFTESEYDRAKLSLIKAFENAYNERDKQKHSSYAREYVDHFTNGGYIPGIEYEYEKTKEIAPHITVGYINEYFNQVTGDKNVALTLLCPDKEGVELPSDSLLLSWYQETKAETLVAYEDKVSSEPLMTEELPSGKISKIFKDKVFETTNYVLANGVKVIIKPTHFKDDEILMTATSPGGSSLFPEDQLVNIKTYSMFSNIGGLRDFSAIELGKLLTGKKVGVSPNISMRKEGMTGSSSPKDFETMLQLVYLHFTAARMDEEAFQSYKTRLSAQLKSQEADPSIALVDSLNSGMYQSPERMSRLKPEDIDKIDYQTIMNWRKNRYLDASDFTFVFVGNIHPAEAQPLVTKYLGNLPSIKRKESPKEVNLNYKKGKIRKEFDKQMENQKSTVIDIYSGTLQPTLANKIYMSMLQQILNIVYTETIREKEGGTYGVGVRASISEYPKGQSSIQISFDTNADKKDHLNEIAHRELRQIAQNGPKIEDFNKVKEFMLKKHAENKQENGYWLGIIQRYAEDKYDGYTQYSNLVQTATPDHVRNLAASLLKQGNLLEVIMVGVK